MVHQKEISIEEEEILRESIAFYKEVYAYFKSIDLSELSDNEASELLQYMHKVFNTEIFVQNNVRFESVFRVSAVSEAFLAKGKVRDLNFLKEPPLKLIKDRGVHGRANLPNSTVFYCAISPGIALFETKPKIGDRIIIGQWTHKADEPFVMYPITNSKNIRTKELDKATSAFQDRMEFNHPLFAEILDLYFDFVSAEFLKDMEVLSEKKYEYLFSSYFADMVLKNTFKPLEDPLEPLKHYDAIIYPSIASKYATENLAVVPSSVKKLKPESFTDSTVLTLNDSGQTLYGYRLPFTLEINRTSYWVEDDLVMWDDD